MELGYVQILMVYGSWVNISLLNMSTVHMRRVDIFKLISSFLEEVVKYSNPHEISKTFFFFSLSHIFLPYYI